MADDKRPPSGLTDMPPQKFMTAEEMQELMESSHKNLVVSFNTESQEYWISYRGKENLTMIETIKMWGYMTDWIVGRAREIDTQIEEPQAAQHVIRAFAGKIKALGEHEWERIQKAAEDADVKN